MKALFVATMCCIFSVQAVANNEKAEPAIGIPAGTFLFSTTLSDSPTSAGLWGGELQFNIKKDEFPLAIGLHGVFQKQSFSVVDTWRWGLGASINFYQQIGAAQLYLGAKTLTYYGGGQKEKALDCLYCSNVEESYSGGENFITTGIIINHWVIQVDRRITDNKSKWSESAYDPYGVGASYYNAISIPDPEFIFHIGRSF